MGWEIVCAHAPEGDYVFSGGMTRCDYSTFCRAMEELPYPALLVTPPPDEGARHGTYFDAHAVSANVKIRRDINTLPAWIDAMANARVVVVCTEPMTIHAPGLSTYVLAMALGKCVIITESAATRDLIEDARHAILVSPGDPVALRRAIRRAWEDTGYRHEIARQGCAYARGLGGMETLLHNIALEVVRLVHSSG